MLNLNIRGSFFLCGLRCSLGCHVMSLFIYLFNFCLAFQMSPNMYFIISSDCTSTAPPPTLLYLSQTQSHDQNGWRRGVFWAENRKRKRENAKLCIKMRTVTSLWINRDYLYYPIIFITESLEVNQHLMLLPQRQSHYISSHFHSRETEQIVQTPPNTQNTNHWIRFTGVNDLIQM